MEMKSLDIDFTQGCNMACSHCFADAHFRMPNELDTDELKSLLDQASKYELSRLSWGLGGEALTRRDIFELLEHGKQYGFPQVLITNGLLVTEEVAKRLAALGVRVSVSLDGATDATHEKLRILPGSLQKAIRACRRLKAAGVTTGANMTVTKVNVHEVGAFLDLALELDLDYISMGNILPFGRALERPELILDQADFDSVLEEAKRRAAEGYPIPVYSFDGVLDLVFNAQRIIERGAFSPRRTSAGRGKVVVRPDGTVWPCQLLPFPAGNVRDKPLDEILQSPVFEQVAGFVTEYEEQKSDCGSGCACSWIMNNERDTIGANVMDAWKAIQVAVPDALGEKVKAALAARRQVEA
ncbi:MAG: radical SAM protein [Euryarchaeota archaeon]|nr:radical SAM protein [Euryarchaeota archaeon]